MPLGDVGEGEVLPLRVVIVIGYMTAPPVGALSLYRPRGNI